MQNCCRSIENYCFKHKNLLGFRGFAPDPHQGICPLYPAGWRSRTRNVSHVCINKKNP